MSGLTLYAITEQYQRLQEMLETGEVDEQAIKDTLASVEGDLTVKVDNCAAVMRSLELEADAFRYEEVRLAERRKSIEANRERLRRYVQFELESVKVDKVKGSRFYVTIQTNPPKLFVDDETKLPEDFWVETRAVDKAAVSAALKAGQEVPGAHLEQGRSLRVK